MSNGFSPDRPIDLGAGHVLRPITRYHAPSEVIGFILDHPNKADPSKPCAGSLWVEKHEQHGFVWQVLSEDPITLAPSFGCALCPDHGFIQAGKWQPA